MAKAKSTALKKLIERNLVRDPKQNSKDSRKKKLSKPEIKARRLRRELNNGVPTEVKPAKPTKNTSNTKSAEATEIENLKNEIARELETKATYVKRQFRAEVPLGWEGLTPGLAPVGYDPDESDSDEDPY